MTSLNDKTKKVIKQNRSPLIGLSIALGLIVLTSFLSSALSSKSLLSINDLGQKISYALALFFCLIVSRNLLIQTLSTHKQKNHQAHRRNTLSALQNLSLFSLYAVGAFWILNLFGVNLTSLVAVGGIAGLAVGLASKDLLANLFGGMMIFLDKPFQEGDWIRSPDRTLEGTVKNIGLRVTMIETFDKRPLYIPNGVFNSIIIENPQRMRNRRIYEKFSLRYGDAELVQEVLKQIQSMLQQHPQIDEEAPLMVNLVSLGDSSLDCEVYCFTKTTDWKDFRDIKQEVLLDIIRIIRDNKADLPFPTRTIEFNPTSVPKIIDKTS